MKKLTLILMSLTLNACDSPPATDSTALAITSTSTTPVVTTTPAVATTVASPTVVTVTQPTSFSHFVYVSNKGDNTISQYGIDTRNGNLWPIGTTVQTLSQPSILFMDNTKKWLFVIHANSTYLDIFSIDQTSGLLTFSSSFPTGNINTAYFWNFNQLILNNTSSPHYYNFNPTTGVLSSVGQFAGTVQYSKATTIMSAPGATYTYQLQGTNNIELYTVGNNGWVDSNKGFATGNTPSSLMIF